MPKLFVVGTPIGNLGDITFRAAETLRNIKVVACEDTRVTRKLLEHLDAHPKLISVREENQKSGAMKVIQNLEAGLDVAYCTDAGTPCISDPGAEVVREVRTAGFEVEAIPGVSAVATALSIAGLPLDRFLFVGFLSANKSYRRKELEELKTIESPLVFFESPHRGKKFFEDALEILGDRHCVICRELTKKFEEVIDASLSEAGKKEDWLGELVIVVESAGRDEGASEIDMEDWMRKELSMNSRPGAVREIARQAAKLFNISGSDAYRLLLKIKKEEM